MTTRTKILLAGTLLLLLAVALFFYRLTDIAAFILEGKLREAGFRDVTVEVSAINGHESLIGTLRGTHDSFSLRSRDIRLRYKLADLLDARVEQIDIASIQLALHEAHGGGELAAVPVLPVLPAPWLDKLPFERIHIKQARLIPAAPLHGITQLDVRAEFDRVEHGLDSRFMLTAPERTPLRVTVSATRDGRAEFSLSDAASSAPPLLSLHLRDLAMSADRFSMKLAGKAEFEALRAPLHSWLPEFDAPDVFSALQVSGGLEYLHASQRLRGEAILKLTGDTLSLEGPISANYQNGDLELVIGAQFKAAAREQHLGPASFPELKLSSQDELNCAWQRAEAQFECGRARLELDYREVSYPPYGLLGDPATITLDKISADTDGWRVQADLDLPAVVLNLPGNSLRLDHVHSELHITGSTIDTTTDIKAADGKLAMHVHAHHDMAAAGGKAEVVLQPLVFDAEQDIPAMLLRDWPYPLQISGGQFRGDTQLSWRKVGADMTLSQLSVLHVDELDGKLHDYPFTGLDGGLRIEGLDPLRISAREGLRLTSIDPGIPISNIVLRAHASRSGGQAFTGRLLALEASALGGVIRAADTDFDLNRAQNRLTLDVRGLDIGELFKLEQKQGLRGSGKLNGKLPLLLDQHGLSMEQGTLAAQAPYGVIQYTGDERANALAKNNRNVEILLKALSDFHYDKLETDLDYAPNGQLLAKVRLQGKNPELEGGRPIHFNVNIEENIPALLKSLQFADEISRKVGESIEQRAAPASAD